MIRDVFYFGKKPNAHPREQYAVNLTVARQQATTEHFWVVNEYCDYKNIDWDFDFDFLPDEVVWTQNFNNAWPSVVDKDSGTWLCPKEQVTDFIFRTDVEPLLLKSRSNWKLHDLVDMKEFDFNWKPDPHDPPYIYIWGTKDIPAELQPALEYQVDGATDKKYMGNVKVLPQWSRWKELSNVDKSKFDFTWRPDPREPAFIYVWGSKFDTVEIKPVLEYHVSGATDRKYMQDIVELVPEYDRWIEHIKVDRDAFDMSWRPSVNEPPYIYVWGNKFDDAEKKATLEYVVPGATDKKYMGVVDLAPEWDRWTEHIKVDRTRFDFSWRPDPNLYEPPFIYVWGNKYDAAEVKPTVEYTVPCATERKYMGIVDLEPEWARWKIPAGYPKNFDFSWRPDPNLHEMPYIYQWEDNGPSYTVPGATEIKYMEYDEEFVHSNVAQYFIKTTIEDLILEHPNEVFWALNPDLNYENFDFNWKPTGLNFRHINIFGNEYSKNTQTYYINAPMYEMGYREFNYVSDKAVEVESNLSMFYIDRNGRGIERFEQLKERYPQLQKTRYLNSWVETIQRCCNKSETKLFWILNSEIDYSEFNFDFYPSPWQMNMVHVFGTQWTHWGNTYLINKETFVESTKYVKLIEHLNILNFVKTKRTKAVERLYDIVLIDHGNNHDLSADYTVKYEKTYLNTLKNMLLVLPDFREQFVWVTSSICDYKDFDFTYVCDFFAKEQLHVFPSDNQKFGDTFLINVNKLRTLIDSLEKLEEYEKVNYNQHQKVNRLPAPIIHVPNDTHCESINIEYDFPYVVFQTEDVYVKNDIPLNLWETDTKTITVTTTGGTRIIVPKEAKDFVKKELYDYPYIKKLDKLGYSKPLDIVFFSNGESCADQNYEHLLFITAGKNNRVIRVDGVNGRIASQHAAANSSSTPWYFLVNAKLKVDKNFDFDWQPDRLQIPKHYIFRATNPVTGLSYGHMAIVANNKNITLNTIAKGLDFTMDGEHEVIDIDSGVGMYNSSPWDTWRTAFRETLKLKYYVETNYSMENKYRLNSWLQLDDGEHGKYSTQGAQDAVNYYESVNGDFEKLKLSYDWAWLEEYYNNLTK